MKGIIPFLSLILLIIIVIVVIGYSFGFFSGILDFLQQTENNCKTRCILTGEPMYPIYICPPSFTQNTINFCIDHFQKEFINHYQNIKEYENANLICEDNDYNRIISCYPENYEEIYKPSKTFTCTSWTPKQVCECDEWDNYYNKTFTEFYNVSAEQFIKIYNTSTFTILDYTNSKVPEINTSYFCEIEDYVCNRKEEIYYPDWTKQDCLDYYGNATHFFRIDCNSSYTWKYILFENFEGILNIKHEYIAEVRNTPCTHQTCYNDTTIIECDPNGWREEE